MVDLNESICNERHKAIEEKFGRHEKWLGEHEVKIDRLDRSDATNTQAINDLCKRIAGQTKAIWGLVSMVAAALIGFFFAVVQNGLFK